MDEQNRMNKEAFVSGLKGTSFGETVLMITVIPFAILLILTSKELFRKGKHNTSSSSSFVLEYCMLVLPMIAVMCGLSALIPAIGCLLLFAVHYLSHFEKNVHKPPTTDSIDAIDDTKYHHVLLDSRYKPFVSNYRSSMMLLTCIAILAVDFHIFPRRFAKTETYGVSVMDMGVGAFVMSSGLIYKQVRTHKSMFRSVMKAGPLFALGMVRLAMVKGTQYQEHVSEYGTHWNFFFTLAVIVFISSLINIDTKQSAFWGIALAIGYQAALSSFLMNYITTHPRTNLIHQNKEGLCSSIGYISIFLVGAQIGDSLLRKKRSIENWWLLLGKLAFLDALLWIVTLLVNAYVEPCSRRTANLAYVLMILAINLQILIFLLLIDLWCGTVRLELVSAINRNSLIVFLLANLAVGIINVSINTMEFNNPSSFFIITLYMLFLCVTASTLHSLNITLKFW